MSGLNIREKCPACGSAVRHPCSGRNLPRPPLATMAYSCVDLLKSAAKTEPPFSLLHGSKPTSLFRT